jgi:murein DD-endopeptidase MepM/ murein hydrolase activator NlpD
VVGAVAIAAVALIASGCFPPGGLVAYLYADDGNVYYYGHMSETVGGDRPVGQGEEIGLVGEIGNATAPHLYFDMRLGNVNGYRPDPYNTLRNAGC